MPAYSYKERFVPKVLDGSKNQTIRKRRKKGFAKIGSILYHYYGLRTRYCRKLGQSICKDVRTIMIKKNGAVIIFDTRLTDREVAKALRGNLMGIKLSDHAKNELAEKDGFYGVEHSSFDLMYRWWKQTHQLPFIGDIIYWDLKTFVLHNKLKPATGSVK